MLDFFHWAVWFFFRGQILLLKVAVFLAGQFVPTLPPIQRLRQSNRGLEKTKMVLKGLLDMVGCVRGQPLEWNSKVWSKARTQACMGFCCKWSFLLCASLCVMAKLMNWVCNGTATAGTARKPTEEVSLGWA